MIHNDKSAPDERTLRDAAIFNDLPGCSDAIAAHDAQPGHTGGVLISDDPGFLTQNVLSRRLSSADLGLDSGHLDAQIILSKMRNAFAHVTSPVIIVVDTRWIMEFLDVDAAFETWSTVIETLVAQDEVKFISVYNRMELVERQMQAVMRAHAQFLAPSGLYDNPFWLPIQLRNGAGIDAQLSFILGRVVPDFQALGTKDFEDRAFASGTASGWLAQGTALGSSQQSSTRWQIRCLGQLKVYQGGQLVEWNIPGGAAQKSRALFCYLLHSGDKGAQVDRIAELIWPDDASEAKKRGRLHHAIAMLRKTLGGKQTVSRNGEYYALTPPPGSWTDILAFEQACRSGLILAKADEAEAALRQYRQAERLYSGDLFEELPVEYTHSELEDWCRPQRRWLRQMQLKLLRDMSIVLRSLEQLDEALNKCQKALSIEPANETSNMEMLRVLHAQSRFDAMERQLLQYLDATDQNEDDIKGTAIQKLYRTLTR